MEESSSNTGSGGFFAYYRRYAHSGIHAASAAALTAMIGLATFARNRWFVVFGIGVYVFPPIFLYLTDEGENVPTIVGTDTTDTANTDDTLAVGDESDSGVADHESAADSNVTERTESSVSNVGIDHADTIDVGPDWNAVDVPTENSLYDAVSTANSAFAVGDGGVVLDRHDEEWSVAVENGPTANSNPLRGVDATADGGALWFAGDNGVLGRYENTQLTDHSAPDDRTDTWTDVAITGKAGTERIHLVNGSGELLRGTYDGGTIEWDEIEKPGSGSSIAALAFADDDRGYLCDTNQSVYATTDGGKTDEEIGIKDANTAFTDIAATDSAVVVTGDDGSLFRFDGAVWTRFTPGESSLSAVDLVDGGGLVAGDAGAVFELVDDRWESVMTPIDADLAGVSIGRTGPDIAVGVDGTIIERRR